MRMKMEKLLASVCITTGIGMNSLILSILVQWRDAAWETAPNKLSLYSQMARDSQLHALVGIGSLSDIFVKVGMTFIDS